MLLNDYIKKQAELEKLQKELEALKTDERLVSELAFKDKVLALMAEHGKSKLDVIKLLAPESTSIKATNVVVNKRRLKRYTNPHTKEEIETRSGNNKAIRSWKENYPSDDVDSWAEFVE